MYTIRIWEAMAVPFCNELGLKMQSATKHLHLIACVFTSMSSFTKYRIYTAWHANRFSRRGRKKLPLNGSAPNWSRRWKAWHDLRSPPTAATCLHLVCPLFSVVVSTVARAARATATGASATRWARQCRTRGWLKIRVFFVFFESERLDKGGAKSRQAQG